MQSNIESIIETSVDVATGFVVAWAAWQWMIPVFWPQLDTGMGVGFGVTCVFTVLSFGRKYMWRRFFANGFHTIVVNRLVVIRTLVGKVRQRIGFGKGNERNKGR